MKLVLFYHSLVSDWNHGNAHFLRGIVTELLSRGHEVVVYEPSDGWSRRNLIASQGAESIERFERAFPHLRSKTYDLQTLDLQAALDHADVVLVHEWNDPQLVSCIGEHHAREGRYVLLFHDTHHRSATASDEIRNYWLEAYDGVLAFGEVVRERYLELGWARRAFTWHEAADTSVFVPQRDVRRARDLVWIGNWGDDERSAELSEFLIRPAGALRCRATAHGVRYPKSARELLRRNGIDFGGWVANHVVPSVFARHELTVHVPRRPYVEALPGVPTIRVFEALACGIPLICSPWSDVEGLFRPGRDFVIARDGTQMKRMMSAILADRHHAAELSRSGLETIEQRHTCRHRVDELLAIVDQIGQHHASNPIATFTPEASA